jgi:hypothetical protein
VSAGDRQSDSTHADHQRGGGATARGQGAAAAASAYYKQTDSASLADAFLRELQQFAPPSPPAGSPSAAGPRPRAVAVGVSPLSTASHALAAAASGGATARAGSSAGGGHVSATSAPQLITVDHSGLK